METKLTLKMDNAAINSAKEYAKNNNKSLSRLVEDFFNNLVNESNPLKKYPPLIEKMSGIISSEDLKKISLEDERVRYILRNEK